MADRLGPVRKVRRADPAAMEAALRQFLEAAGLDPSHPDLAESPRRATQAWLQEFLSGYTQEPEHGLEERFSAPAQTPVVVTGLQFVSVCPHHLLPYAGVAHVAYLPEAEVVGFSRLSKLVNILSRRMVLQETLTRQVAETLHRVLQTSGSACLVTATQACMALRGVEQRESQCTTLAWQGRFASDPTLQQLFLNATGPGGLRR